MYRVLFLGFCKKKLTFFLVKINRKKSLPTQILQPKKKNKGQPKKTAKKTKKKKKKKSRGDILADKQDFFRSQEIKNWKIKV